MAHPFPFIEPQFFDANGNPLAGGSLYSYQAGTTTPLATFTDQTEGTPNTNPVTLDANGRAAIWIGSSAYKFVLKDASGNTIWTYDNVSYINPGYVTVGMLSNSTVLYRWGGSAGGSANALTLTPSDTLSAYTTGIRYAFLATASNTGAATINISGLGPKAVTGGDGSALSANQILSGSMYSLTYDGTQFRVHEILSIANASVTLAKLASNARDLVIPAAITTSSTAVYTSDLVLVDCTSGAVTLTLYAASTGNKPIRYKKIDSTFNAVTIIRAGSDTMQEIASGATSTTLNTQGEEVTIAASSSTTFAVYDRRIPAFEANYGPITIKGVTGDPNMGTVTTNKLWGRRIGSYWRGRYEFSSSVGGTTGTGNYKFPFLPSGLVSINTSNLTAYTGTGNSGTTNCVGTGNLANGTNALSCQVVVYDGTYVRLLANGSGGQTWVGDSSFALNSATNYAIDFDIPITGWNG